MRPVDTLISARWVVPIVPRGTVLTDHSVAIEHGRIVALLPTAAARSQFEPAQHIALAQQFAAWVDADPAFERLAPVPFSVVCFRARPALPIAPPELDAFNEELLGAVNASGDVFLSLTRIRGVVALRLAVGHVDTDERHLRRAWDLLRAHAAELTRARRIAAEVHDRRNIACTFDSRGARPDP